jgi:hypothetical protein
MEIYIAFFAGLLGVVLLAAVYLADRYEREPIELIQNAFLSGLFIQLVMILAATGIGGVDSWNGAWLLITAVAAALYLPFQLGKQDELDEVFDGIVYAVAFMGGAVCVIHIHRLPGVIAASPFGEAVDPGAIPDLRDLVILATSRGFGAELGQSLVLVASAVLFGTVLATLQLRGWPSWKTAAVCAAVAVGISGFDLATGGIWPVRGALAILAVVTAAIVKKRSRFKEGPEPSESDVLVMGLKTILMVFGAALLTTTLLQATADAPAPPDPVPAEGHESGGRHP